MGLHLLQQDTYLRAIVRILHGGTTEGQFAAASALDQVISEDPHTHYVVAQVLSHLLAMLCGRSVVHYLVFLW